MDYIAIGLSLILLAAIGMLVLALIEDAERRERAAWLMPQKAAPREIPLTERL